jgi:HSP20 family protein
MGSLFGHADDDGPEGGLTRPWRLLSPDLEATVPVEVTESDDEIEVKAEMPGVKPEDVNITLSNGLLNIKAEHREEKQEKQKNYVRQELRYGSMQRTLNLPATVDADKAEASFENGIVRLKFPKSPGMKAKRIPISGVKQIAGN